MSLTRRDVFPAALAAMAAGQQPGALSTRLDLEPNLFTRLGVRVRINGEGPFVMVLDTGAERSVLAASVARRLSLPPGPDLVVHDVAEAITTPSVRIPRLSLADSVFNDLVTPVFARERLAADGLIGLDILDRFRLHLDLRGQTAVLSRARPAVRFDSVTRFARSGPRAILPSSRGPSGRLMLHHVAAGEVSVAAFIDSGAQHSVGNLALARLVLSRRDEALAPPTAVYGLGGTAIMAQPGRLADLGLGSVRLSDVALLFADLHCFDILGLRDQPALLLGADIMGRFDFVTLDFPSDRIVFAGVRPGGSTRL